MNLKIGDRVFDPRYGWGTRRHFILGHFYLIEFDMGKSEIYTSSGYSDSKCKYKSLSTHETVLNIEFDDQFTFKSSDVGMPVSDPIHGDGYIIGFDVPQPEYPVIVQFNSGVIEYYSRDGKDQLKYRISSLFKGHGVRYIGRNTDVD